MNPSLATLAVIVAAYLIGSVSFAVVVSRLFGLPDPHSYGSGNPGATNVLRTGSKAAALLTLFGDGVKGFAAVVTHRSLPREPRLPFLSDTCIRSSIVSRAVKACRRRQASPSVCPGSSGSLR